ncbi:MAG: metallophosphoesterase [Planctomycetota bacterium]
MRLLAFSDIHRDLNAVGALADLARDADLLVGAGDFATKRNGLQPVIDAIAAIGRPAVLVHGNGESEDELRQACRGYDNLCVRHGGSVELDGVTFFGLGAAVPQTPFGSWSVDLSEREAARLLAACPPDAVLVTHSPPLGHCDRASSGSPHGSSAILACVERTRPRLVLCGHIHDSWGETSRLGPTEICNLGPAGRLIELPSGPDA